MKKLDYYNDLLKKSSIEYNSLISVSKTIMRNSFILGGLLGILGFSAVFFTLNVVTFEFAMNVALISGIVFSAAGPTFGIISTIGVRGRIKELGDIIDDCMNNIEKLKNDSQAGNFNNKSYSRESHTDDHNYNFDSQKDENYTNMYKLGYEEGNNKGSQTIADNDYSLGYNHGKFDGYTISKDNFNDYYIDGYRAGYLTGSSENGEYYIAGYNDGFSEGERLLEQEKNAKHQR